MFRGAYQRKLLTILYSGGSNPLEIWNIQVRNGWTRRVKDEDMGSIVFEIAGTNVATAYIVSPPDPRGTLGITLPYITMFIKNLKRYFTFEIQIMDDKNMRRRFRFSNYQSATKVRPFTCSVPLALKPGWNQMQLNLANFTTRAYGTNYMETQRVQIHANCRVRRIYFSDRLYSEEELPRDYRVYMNLRQAQQKGGEGDAAVQSILKRPSQTEPPPSEELVKLSSKDKAMKVPSIDVEAGVVKRPSQTEARSSKELERLTSKEDKMKKALSAEKEAQLEIPPSETAVDDTSAEGQIKRTHTADQGEAMVSPAQIDESGVAEVAEASEVERKGSKGSRRSVTLTPVAEEGEEQITPGPDAEMPEVPDEMLTEFPTMAEGISESAEGLAATDEGIPEEEPTAEEEGAVQAIERVDTSEHPEVLESPAPEEATEAPEDVQETDTSEEAGTPQVEKQGSKSSAVLAETTDT
ncbi:fibrous sheath CABYR-binding protein-like [Homalodisca vitripennis]|uniref:fibrous sheath CABYR-binding protein-like n=1 Tax=Homalodisca vitripennis TaxID=197043 RepID=UPI001EE9E22A|nr:fibrous sheath CABYR-binding protein-like [Homalodisca vitripennis]